MLNLLLWLSLCLLGSIIAALIILIERFFKEKNKDKFLPHDIFSCSTCGNKITPSQSISYLYKNQLWPTCHNHMMMCAVIKGQ